MGLNSPILSILLAVVVIAILVYRQLRPRKVSTQSLVIFPLIILFFLVEALPSYHFTNSKLLEITISSAVSIIFGLLACRQLKVQPHPATGKAMVSGSWQYFLWWLAAFIVKAALSYFFGEISISDINQVDILIPLFFLTTTRNAYLYWRIAQSGLQLHGRHE